MVHIYGILNYGGQCLAPKGVCALFFVEEVEGVMFPKWRMPFKLDEKSSQN